MRQRFPSNIFLKFSTLKYLFYIIMKETYHERDAIAYFLHYRKEEGTRLCKKFYLNKLIQKMHILEKNIDFYN